MTQMIRKNNLLTGAKAVGALLVCIMGISPVWAQSNLMEGRNNIAMYLKSQDFKQLEAARKFSDAAYQTRRDSASFKHNMLRALVYSTLAVVDSNRTQQYMADPIDVAMGALQKINGAPPQAQYDHGAEIHYIKRSLANAYLIKANRATAAGNAEEALAHFAMVDSLGGSAYENIQHNLAVLKGATGDVDAAISGYQSLIADKERAQPRYVLELADLYSKKDEPQEALSTLLAGRQQFPDSKDVLFELINTYVANEAYDAIIPVLTEALAHEPENVDLNFIAGYANEREGNTEVARRYYEKVIALDPNNFEGNFELGLLYLKEYMQQANSTEKRNKAQEYLLKANQIKPSEINTLRSLAVLYDKSGDIVQLERVNNILNQRIID